jgi:hypothetical protein
VLQLSPSGQELLDACAKAIALDKPSKIDLFLLTREQSFYEEAPDYLANQVELESRGEYTIRVADTALFASRVMGINRYLVRCPFGTPERMVTELTDDMFLVSVGPYSNGFELHAKQATPEEVARSRAKTAVTAARQAVEQAAEDIAKAEVSEIISTLIRRINISPGIVLRERLTDELRAMSYGRTELGKIIAICNRIGIDFVDIVKEAYA